jgi:hypothetical protein
LTSAKGRKTKGATQAVAKNLDTMTESPASKPGVDSAMGWCSDFLAHLLPFMGSVAPPPQTPKSSSPMKFVSIKSESFQFRASLPEPFKLERKLVEKLWTTMVSHQEADGAFSVNYARLPSPEEMAKMANPNGYNGGPVTFDVERGLDGAAKSSVDYMHGKTTSTARIALLNKFSGREVEGTLPNNAGLFRERIYIVNGAVLQMTVVGKPAWVNSNEAYRFLDSLKLAI